MIQEDYVTFEQAKALKELGFPQWNGNTHNPYYEGYSLDGKETSVISSNCKMEYSKVPLSLVQKWLREEKDYVISIVYASQTNTYGYWVDKTYGYGEHQILFETYEQALSTGIDECIKFLKEQKDGEI